MYIGSNPDVMLEVVYEHPVSVIFFVAYLVITFYYLMNVVSTISALDLLIMQNLMLQ